jgi:predicted  nucleic acid-binding Zn-ribbon protein
MEDKMDWEEFMVHRVMRVDSGMKVAKRDLVELRSKLTELQEEMAGNFEGLRKELKALREEYAELRRRMGLAIKENWAMGGWLREMLCQLEEKLETEVRNEPEGSDTEKEKDRERSWKKRRKRDRRQSKAGQRM